MNKKGNITQWFGAMMMLVLIGIMVIIAMFLLSNLDSAFATINSSSTASNVTGGLVDNIEEMSFSIGMVVIVIFLGLVMGVLFAAFSFGGGNSSLGNDKNEDDEKNEKDEEDSEEEEEDEEYEKCEYCNRDLFEDNEDLECDKCGEDICVNCRIKIGNEDYCKECYDKKKQRIEQTKKEVVKEEVKPIIATEKSSFEKKNKFEEKSKYD